MHPYAKCPGNSSAKCKQEGGRSSNGLNVSKGFLPSRRTQLRSALQLAKLPENGELTWTRPESARRAIGPTDGQTILLGSSARLGLLA